MLKNGNFPKRSFIWRNEPKIECGVDVSKIRGGKFNPWDRRFLYFKPNRLIEDYIKFYKFEIKK